MTPHNNSHDFSAHGSFSSRSAPQERKETNMVCTGTRRRQGQFDPPTKPHPKSGTKTCTPSARKTRDTSTDPWRSGVLVQTCGRSAEKQKNCRRTAEWQPTSNAIQVTSASASTRLHMYTSTSIYADEMQQSKPKHSRETKNIPRRKKAHHIGALVPRAEPRAAVREAVGWVLLAVLRLAALVVDVHHPRDLVVGAELGLLPGKGCVFCLESNVSTGARRSYQRLLSSDAAFTAYIENAQTFSGIIYRSSHNTARRGAPVRPVR